MEQTRKRVVFRGRVQGVGFRATTHSIASRHEIAGYVRNQPDGTVELVAAGSDPHVTGFLDAVHTRLARYIESSEIEDVIDRDDDLSRFEIRD